MPQNHSQSIPERFSNSVVGNYSRFPLVVREARGLEIIDTDGKRYLDMGSGIAVNCLGHGHPALREALARQFEKLDHISNLYFFEEQVALAEQIIDRIAPGKCFFCNSGAEANEALIKLARKFGDSSGGRYDIITTHNSFHGRTLATIAATGQQKVRTGFGPLFPGFSQVAFNDLNALEEAVTDSTVAILLEGVQGEGGLTPASPEYLRGIRELCTKRNMLFLMDGVQCGHYRTGRFQSIQRILDLPDSAPSEWLPDAISLGKSLGGGFPTAGIWAAARVQDVLSAGSHGTTYGGNPLACAAALAVLQTIADGNLDQNIRSLENVLRSELESLRQRYPEAIESVRGLGFMQGLVLREDAGLFKANQSQAASVQACLAAQGAGLIVIPAGPKVVRFLPPYIASSDDIAEAVQLMDTALAALANSSGTK